MDQFQACLFYSVRWSGWSGWSGWSEWTSKLIKRKAELRKSDVLNNILFIPEKSNSVKPLYKLQREAIKETRSFRRQDNRNQKNLSDQRSKILRSLNYLRRKSNIANISKEKKQIVINNAFQRACKNVKQTDGNRIELSHISEF